MPRVIMGARGPCQEKSVRSHGPPGKARVSEVRERTLDAILRGWRKHGANWGVGERTLSDGRRIAWAARDSRRVRALEGASLNRLVAVLRPAYRLGREKRGLVTPPTFPRYDERELVHRSSRS